MKAEGIEHFLTKYVMAVLRHSHSDIAGIGSCMCGREVVNGRKYHPLVVSIYPEKGMQPITALPLQNHGPQADTLVQDVIATIPEGDVLLTNGVSDGVKISNNC